jgi:hypothetical protein
MMPGESRSGQKAQIDDPAFHGGKRNQRQGKKYHLELDGKAREELIAL